MLQQELLRVSVCVRACTRENLKLRAAATPSSLPNALLPSFLHNMNPFLNSRGKSNDK